MIVCGTPSMTHTARAWSLSTATASLPLSVEWLPIYSRSTAPRSASVGERQEVGQAANDLGEVDIAAGVFRGSVING
jgi:hypothetical protein